MCCRVRSCWQIVISVGTPLPPYEVSPSASQVLSTYDRQATSPAAKFFAGIGNLESTSGG